MTSRLAGLLAAACLLIAACGGPVGAAQSAQFPMTVENCGEQVTVFQRPERIMTVGNIAVNGLYAAGGADRIVVRAGPHDGPLPEPAASAVADVEVLDDDDPSTETILGTGVDTVISYGLTNAAGLADAKITHLVVASACDDATGTFEEVYAEVEGYGTLLGTAEVAAASVRDLRQRVAAVEAAREGAPAETAASFGFFAGSPYVNGNQAITHAMMTALGLTDVFADLDVNFSNGNLEELLERDPDVIVVTYGWIDGRETFEDAKRALAALPGAADLAAVHNDRVVGLSATLAQNDPAAVDGLEAVAEQLAG